MTIHRTLTATLPNITDFHCWDHNPFPVVAPVTWQVPSGVPTHTVRFPHQLHPSFPKAEPQMSHSMKTETARAGFSEERSQRNPWAFISSQSNHAKVSSSQVPPPLCLPLSIQLAGDTHLLSRPFVLGSHTQSSVCISICRLKIKLPAPNIFLSKNKYPTHLKPPRSQMKLKYSWLKTRSLSLFLLVTFSTKSRWMSWPCAMSHTPSCRSFRGLQALCACLPANSSSAPTPVLQEWSGHRHDAISQCSEEPASPAASKAT